MSENATKKDLADLQLSLGKAIDNKIDKAVTDLSAIISGFVSQVDERFNSVESKLFSLETMLAELKVEQLETRKALNRLTNTVDAMMKRYDDNETEMAARDSQFEKLLAWARKVSEKTGIPLENL